MELHHHAAVKMSFEKSKLFFVKALSSEAVFSLYAMTHFHLKSLYAFAIVGHFTLAGTCSTFQRLHARRSSCWCCLKLSRAFVLLYTGGHHDFAGKTELSMALPTGWLSTAFWGINSRYNYN